tara:strand:- start:277 stop:528 length:252 start_codon:yes stop_codon:yes gene_type:complete
MKITKAQLRKIIKEEVVNELNPKGGYSPNPGQVDDSMYDPEMSVEGLMEVIKDLDGILLDIFRVTGDTEAQRAHHMLDKLLGR